MNDLTKGEELEREHLARPTYEEACESATYAQNLHRIVVALAAAMVPVTVDQTGGFTMCVRVAPAGLDNGATWLWITRTDIGDEGYCVCRYDDGDQQEGTMLAESADVGEVIAIARQFHQTGGR